MNNGGKINLKYILALILTALFFFITLYSPANYIYRSKILKNKVSRADTLPQTPKPAPDTALRGVSPKDSTKLLHDSSNMLADTSIKDSSLHDSMARKTDTFQLKFSKDSLQGTISYSAADSVVLDVPTKDITLYNKANAKYTDMTLDAYKILIDQPRQVLVATYMLDTAGKQIGKPKMVQTDNTMESDSLVFNMKNKKGITVNTYTQSGEMYVLGEKMKKVSPEEYFAFHGRFTTCNLDTPHFAFRTKKMKLINKKMAISGPIHPEFEGVPIPIYIPFGFFPISQGRHSGFLPPAFNASPNFGLGLEGLGYYRVINDNFDVITRANIYSYGGWNLYITPEYKVRYRYSGHINFTYQNTIILSTAGAASYDKSKTFSFSWAHTVDSKARPGQTFSANVNFMSTKFNQFVSNNPTANFNNQISSSIAYSKTWDGKYNLTLSGTHSQNNETKFIQVNLPSLGFTATTLYPFQRKEFVGSPKWYEKLGIGLTTNIMGQTGAYDSLFSFKKLIDTFQWGAQHTIPISVALPPLLGGALQLAPGISFGERWYSRKLIRSWDNAKLKVDTTITKGFWTGEDLGFSLNLSTALFGTFTNFGKNSSILGIRHVLRPTIGISYKPNLAGKYYYSTRVDTSQRTLRFSDFDGNTYGAFTEGTFGGISFGLDNNIEMKKKAKEDTSESGTKKIKLIDGFGFNGSYNYLADSFKLSPITFYLRSTLFGMINITGGATLDPYAVDSTGFRLKTYAWNQKGKGFTLGRITNGNVAVSASFKSKPKDEKKAEADKQAALSQLPMTVEEQQAELAYIRNNPAEFADFNVAWSLNIQYSLSFTKQIKPDYSGYSTILNSTTSINGDFNLTENWKMGFSTYYDVKAAKIQSLTTFVSRNMHCWQMSINVTPVGPWRSFNVTLSPKSGILRDLKINRARTFY